MSILQLNPTIPVSTPKGDGYALFLIDYSTEHDLYWVVAINDTREIWTYPNKEIRVVKNITMGRVDNSNQFGCVAFPGKL